MTLWITKYALARGVERVDNATTSGKIAAAPNGSGGNRRWRKPHWHATEAEAIAQVEKMRAREFQAAQKRVARFGGIEPVELVRSAK